MESTSGSEMRFSMGHEQLVARAVTWLRNQKCPLVLAGMASCSEIPDAIGFARNRTVVVECKTSRADFHNDHRKYGRHVRPDGATCSLKAPLKWRKMFSDCPIEMLPNMGTERWYLSESGVVTLEMVEEHHPDHGLLHVDGKRLLKVRKAPLRDPARRDTHAEVQYLQFALRHLLDNLGSKGVKVDVLRATKMFGRNAIDLHSWQKANL